MDGHAVCLIPLERIEPELLGILETAQDARKENAVVSAVRLGAEHANLKSVRPPRHDFLDHFGAGHAGAHDNNRRLRRLFHSKPPRAIVTKYGPRAIHHSPFGENNQGDTSRTCSPLMARGENGRRAGRRTRLAPIQFMKSLLVSGAYRLLVLDAEQQMCHPRIGEALAGVSTYRRTFYTVPQVGSGHKQSKSN